MNLNNWSVADLCDEHENDILVIDRGYKRLGGKLQCHGPVRTVRLDTDNSKLIELLSKDGKNGVVFVHSQNTKAALVGDRLATKALENNWAGMIVDGAVRDLATIANIEIGIFANSTYPVRGARNGGGEIDVPIALGDLNIVPGQYIYGDSDGVILSKRNFFADENQ